MWMGGGGNGGDDSGGDCCGGNGTVTLTRTLTLTFKLRSVLVFALFGRLRRTKCWGW